MKRSFTIVEILMVLCIIVIVATICIPVFQSIQTQTKQATANQMTNQINAVYAAWKDSGGNVSGTPYGSMVLCVLTSPGNSAVSVASPSGDCTVSDGGNSTIDRLSIPTITGVDLNPNDSGGLTQTNVVLPSGSSNSSIGPITYNPSLDSFYVLPSSSYTWSDTGWSSSVVGVSSGTTSAPFGQIAYLNSTSVTHGNLNFGVLYYASPNSGTFYAYDASNGQLYQATYTLTSSTGGALEKKTPVQPAMKGYTPYKMIGVSAGAPFVVIPSRIWTITYQVAK